jgi:hypothetical protein
MQLVQMKDRRIQGFVPVTGNPDVTHLKVAVYYSKDGLNYATYKEEPKGYWLSVTPVKREVQGDYIIETMTGFSGYRCFICSGDRFNRKTLTTLWANVVEDETNNEGAVAQMMERVKGEKSLQSV